MGSRTLGSTTTVYVQSGQQTIADYTAGAAPASSTYRYVYASYIDEPVMRFQTSGSTRVYYHRNQQYSITALTNSSGAVLERYAYTAYGVPTIANSTGTVLTSSAHNNRNTYTGREWDNDLKQYHYRARMYDASLGRFCSRDPIGFKGGINVYQYVDSKPLVKRDPSGEGPWDTRYGYPSNGICKKRSCLLWVKEVDDTYPQSAKACCKGFLKIYSHSVIWDSGREPDEDVICVAKCLIDAENSICQDYDDCDLRGKCRHEAHIACYRECGFIPYKGMPWSCLSIAPEVIGW